MSKNVWRDVLLAHLKQIIFTGWIGEIFGLLI